MDATEIRQFSALVQTERRAHTSCKRAVERTQRCAVGLPRRSAFHEVGNHHARESGHPGGEVVAIDGFRFRGCRQMGQNRLRRAQPERL